VFSLRLGWFPTSGRITYGMAPTTITGLMTLDAVITGNTQALRDALRHLALPATTLGAGVAAVVARVTRSSMLEALKTDYVLFAKAKGVPEVVVVIRHALRNALIPTVTVVGLQMGTLLGGNMIVETIFGWPGLGADSRGCDILQGLSAGPGSSHGLCFDFCRDKPLLQIFFIPISILR